LDWEWNERTNNIVERTQDIALKEKNPMRQTLIESNMKLVLSVHDELSRKKGILVRTIIFSSLLRFQSYLGHWKENFHIDRDAWLLGVRTLENVWEGLKKCTNISWPKKSSILEVFPR